MRKEYTAPKINVGKFSAENVLTLSSNTDVVSGGLGNIQKKTVDLDTLTFE